MRRRSFCLGLGAAGLLWGLGCRPTPPEGGWEDVDGLRLALSQETMTSQSLFQHCRERIESRNPELKAVIELNPQAEELAQRVTEAGPLAGLPILIKDNIATGDRMVTAAGSLALDGSRYPQEAPVVARLRAAGLIPAGKANMSEWSNLRARNSTSGWSGRGGQCRNPHDPARSPSGSSSGSAAALAAGLVPLALGTEMVGSITCPASVCGVVGLKPTLGLVPTEGVIPAAASFDCVGPMARSVKDVAYLLGVLVEPATDYVKDLGRGALKGKRIGVARQEFGFDHNVDQVMEEQLAVLARLGAELVDPVSVVRLGAIAQDLAVVVGHEFKAGVNAYLGRQTPEVQVRTLQDVIRFNEEHAEQEALAYLDQKLLVFAQSRGGLDDPVYRQSRERLMRQAGPEALGHLFSRHRLDAVVAPTTGPAWTIDFVNGDHFEGGGAVPPALAGFPHITVPGGQIHGLPVGISFYAPANTEKSLLQMAYDYEQETRHFRPARG